jgi:tryptophan synthase alpha chain
MKNNRFKKNKKQVSVFITAGYPKLGSTTEQIFLLQSKGVDFIEVGIPFSDPMADGLVIQETSSIALDNGMHLDLLFEQLDSIKDEVKVPLVLMGYLNPVLQYGIREFLLKCKETQISSVIIPDMSVEIFIRFYKAVFEEFNIGVSFLITPETDKERIREIVGMSKNSFIYLVSQKSITGGDSSITKDMNQRYASIKNICAEVPLMLGFGIKNRKDVLKAQENCDGAIIGSAYLKSLKKGDQIRFLDELLF